MAVFHRRNRCFVFLLVHLIVTLYVALPVICRATTSESALGVSQAPVMRPVINVSDELVFSAGVNVTVRCIGNRPVTWNAVPSTQFPSLRNRIIIASRHLDNSSKYESLLTLTDLMYLDTGLYQCVYPEKSDPELVASSYFYVYDGIHLLVDEDKWRRVVAVENRMAVIPWCRSSHPDVRVALEKKQSKRNLESFSAELLSHDPRLGVVISKVTNYFDGAFVCKASYKNLTAEKEIELAFYPSTGFAPTVWLHSDHEGGQTLTGESVTFTCTTKFSPNAMLKVTWFYPLQHERSNRFDESYKKANFHLGNATAKLIVNNFTIHDSGLYGCVARDHDNKTGSAQVNMTAFEKPFVHLTTTQPVVEVLLNKMRFGLPVDVNAYPKPDLHWSKDNQDIALLPNREDKYSGFNERELVINNVQASDAGVYTLRAANNDASSSLNVTLLVNYAPSVRMAGPITNSLLYLINRNYSLDCYSDGFPAPEIKWFWQRCDNATCMMKDKWEPVKQSKDGPWVLSKGKDSRLTASAKESGHYKCVATNKIGSKSEIVKFFVTDVKDGFGIQQNYSSPVIEGDSISVSCVASRFLFDLTELYWLDEDSLMHLNISDDFWNLQDSESQQNRSFKYIVQNFQNEYYAVSTLTFASVQLTDNGSYACVARDLKGTQQQVRMWELTVDPAPDLNSLWSSTDKLPVDSILDGIQTDHRSTPSTLLHLSIIIPISVCLGIVVIAFITTMLCVFKRRPRYNKFFAVHLEELLRSSTDSKYNPDMPIDEQTDVIPYDPQLEFPKDRLQFDVVIGKGAFGTVYRAQAVGIIDSESVTTVAVKTVKDCGKMDQLKALISELKVLIHLGQHINILNALGAVTQDLSKGNLYVIMEYCHYGCLRDHLIKQRCNFIGVFNNSFRESMWVNEAELVGADEVGYLKAAKSPCENYKDDRPLTAKDLVCYAFQIARGLEYLHSKKYIHRDLAARNILLAEGNVVKICDFGLAKDCYKYNEYRKKSSTPVPIKWMAIESLTHNVYTTKSDIWSYGIVLWELFTIGGHPYPTLKIDTAFIELLKAGYRLDRPFLAEDLVYHTMLNCWNSDPGVRPDASQLVETFGGMLEATVKQHYIDLKVQSVDYLRMNSKSGCLESATYTNVEVQSRPESDRQTRMTSISLESGFASPTKEEAADHFEYLPPSSIDGQNGDSGWSAEFGSSLPNPEADYENAQTGFLTGHMMARCGGAGHPLTPKDSASMRSLSFDFSSGVSDAVFEETDSYSPSPYNSAGNPLLTVSM